MVLNLMMALNVLSIFIVLGLLVAGFILCKKNSFKWGMYAFIMLMVNKMYPFIYSLVVTPKVRDYVDSYDYATKRMDLSLGEFLARLSYIHSIVGHLIEMIALTCLVIGLYHMWRGKTA